MYNSCVENCFLINGAVSIHFFGGQIIIRPLKYWWHNSFSYY